MQADPDGVPIVYSKILSIERQLVHGVSTRMGGVAGSAFGMNLSLSVGDDPRIVGQNSRRFFSQLGITTDRLAIPRQVHSPVVRSVTVPGDYPECDALVTNVEELFLVVSIADCLPILLYDSKRSAVAAVHSGWRGSCARIVECAIKLMSDSYGTKASDLIAYIGPGAGSCCYEVGEEVAVQFGEMYVERSHGTRPHLKLQEFNRDLMRKLGVSADRIEMSDDCTICNADRLHSYRRDGSSSGRMMAVIGISTVERWRR